MSWCISVHATRSRSRIAVTFSCRQGAAACGSQVKEDDFLQSRGDDVHGAVVAGEEVRNQTQSLRRGVASSRIHQRRHLGMHHPAPNRSDPSHWDGVGAVARVHGQLTQLREMEKPVAETRWERSARIRRTADLSSFVE